MKKPIGVLASGGGSNLQAILKAGLPVVVVITDRDCGALTIAWDAGIPTQVVDREAYGYPGKGWDRVGFSREIAVRLQEYGVEMVAMAGFMTILEQPMFDVFGGRILNTHPSLLPAFPGAHAVEEALAAGVEVTGCTIHIAVPKVDDGPILAQVMVPIRSGDDPTTLQDRIKRVEHRLYPQTIRRFSKGEIKPWKPSPS